MKQTLTATKRDKGMQSEGMIPAVFYGKTTDSTMILINQIEFEKVYEEAGESAVVTLDMDGDKVDTLIHDVQYHPVRNRPLHVDFYVFDKTQKQEVGIPIEFTGEAPAEEEGGVVVKSLHELEVRALPSELPSELTVDLSLLKALDSVIHASDIALPAGVELVNDPEEVVASITVPTEEEEEPAEVDMSAIEATKEKDDDEEGGEESKTEDKEEE